MAFYSGPGLVLYIPELNARQVPAHPLTGEESAAGAGGVGRGAQEAPGLHGDSQLAEFTQVTLALLLQEASSQSPKDFPILF